MKTKRPFRIAISIFLMVLCAMLGWWLASDVEKSVMPVEKLAPLAARPARNLAEPPPRPAPRRERPITVDQTAVAILASSREMETILRFPSDVSYHGFMDALDGSGVWMVDRLDRVRAMRLGYKDTADLNLLLRGKNISLYGAVTRMPDRTAPGTGIQAGAESFDGRAISWLGVEGDRSTWGAGVTVAVIDTGVLAHESLPGLAKSIAIEPFPENPTNINGHGTAVASMIAGNSRIAPGMAPAVKLISIRVCAEDGTADSFSIAAGLLAAVDEGAQIVNLSMGSYQDSPLMADAVRLLQSRGVVIVAASGNDGQEDAAYPAAYPGVISVGAVDARGEQLNFSNFGSYLSLVAPGYLVNAAWPGNRYVRMSGTSMSAPLVTGSIAATLSLGASRGMTPLEAAAVVMKFTDEAGIPGPDSQYGSGILNMARVVNRDVPGMLDAAITSQRLVANAADGGRELRVTVQNRGTETLINTMLEMATTAGSKNLNATTILPGAIQTFSMPVPDTTLRKDAPFQATSRVSIGTAGRDPTPANNQRTDSFSNP